MQKRILCERHLIVTQLKLSGSEGAMEKEEKMKRVFLWSIVAMKKL